MTTNERNIKTYREIGISKPDELRYTCTLCGEPTSAGLSYSNMGANLICTRCFKSRFKTMDDAFAYINRK